MQFRPSISAVSPSPPRVISYARFSSRRQERGISLERQTRLALDYCAQRGWVLDDELRYRDLGKSGFSGANRETGALGQLLSDLQAGELEKGSYLLIEAFDRLTREEVPKAFSLLQRLLEGGLVVVTLSDQQEWREGMDTMQFMFSIMQLARGHEESKRRSELSKANFRRAREDGNQKMFGSGPGWLVRRDGSKDGVWWSVDEKKAESVRRVFEACAEGLGSKAISARANREGWLIPTRTTSVSTDRWHAQMPRILLNNTAVLGEHEHWEVSLDARRRASAAGVKGAWRGEPTGFRSADYYPKIISDELWCRAHAAIDARSVVPPKKSQQFWNIWSGVMFCGWCGAPMQRKVERKGQMRAQLVCSAHLAGACVCQGSPNGSAKVTDEPLIYHICVSAGSMMGIGPSRETVTRKLDEVRGRLAALAKAEQGLLQVVEDVGYTPRLREAVQRNRVESEQCQSELKSLERDRVSIDGGPPGELFGDVTYADKLYECLYRPGVIEAEEREVFNRKVLRAVHAIWLFAYDCAVVQFKSGALTLVALQQKVEGRERPKLAELSSMKGLGVPPDLKGMKVGGWGEAPPPEWLQTIVRVIH